jgi:hypothetical protein
MMTSQRRRTMRMPPPRVYPATAVLTTRTVLNLMKMRKMMTIITARKPV